MQGHAPVRGSAGACTGMQGHSGSTQGYAGTEEHHVRKCLLTRQAAGRMACVGVAASHTPRDMAPALHRGLLSQAAGVSRPETGPMECLPIADIQRRVHEWQPSVGGGQRCVN